MTTATLAAAAVAVSIGSIALALRSRARAAVMASLAPDDGLVAPGSRPEARRLLSAVGSAIGGATLGWVLAGPVGSAAGVLGCLIVPQVRRRRRRAAEIAALQDGLADAVAAIGTALRAGRSMAGALHEAASTVAPPLGPRLASLVDRVALGVPVDRALVDLVAAVPGPDGRLVAAVLGLHQRSGGDAPAVLDRVAHTLRERRATAREVRSLTAQARLSGAILGFLPIGFFLFLSATARDDVERAVTSKTGATAVAAGLAMQALAFAWIRRLLRVEA